MKSLSARGLDFLAPMYLIEIVVATLHQHVRQKFVIKLRGETSSKIVT